MNSVSLGFSISSLTNFKWMSYAEVDREVWTWLPGSPLFLTIYIVFILLSHLMSLWSNWDAKGMTSLCTGFFKDNVSTDALWERYTQCFFFPNEKFNTAIWFPSSLSPLSVYFSTIYYLLSASVCLGLSWLPGHLKWEPASYRTLGHSGNTRRVKLITIPWLASRCAENGGVGEM